MRHCLLNIRRSCGRYHFPRPDIIAVALPSRGVGIQDLHTARQRGTRDGVRVRGPPRAPLRIPAPRLPPRPDALRQRLVLAGMGELPPHQPDDCGAGHGRRPDDHGDGLLGRREDQHDGVYDGLVGAVGHGDLVAEPRDADQRRQGAEGEQGPDGPLLPPRRLELQDGRDGDDEDRHVADDVDHGRHDQHQPLVDAAGAPRQVVGDALQRRHEDERDGVQQVEVDHDLDDPPERRPGGPDREEYPDVQQQDGQPGEEDRDSRHHLNHQE